MRQLAIIAILVLTSSNSFAETINVSRLADAIYKAEGGASTRHPYGILQKYRNTSPRQACLNTINNHLKRHKAHSCGLGFIECLSRRYAPLNAKNDPNGLNRNWLRNVTKFYEVSNAGL